MEEIVNKSLMVKAYCLAPRPKPNLNSSDGQAIYDGLVKLVISIAGILK